MQLLKSDYQQHRQEDKRRCPKAGRNFPIQSDFAYSETSGILQLVHVLGVQGDGLGLEVMPCQANRQIAGGKLGQGQHPRAVRLAFDLRDRLRLARDVSRHLRGHNRLALRGHKPARDLIANCLLSGAVSPRDPHNHRN
jgi:hypothetical protein